MSPMKPETSEFLNWVRDWMEEQGYEVKDSAPWSRAGPTVVYALDDRGLPAYGLLAHLVTLNDLVKRFGRLMNTNPRPTAVFIFLPRNAPHRIEVELRGRFTYRIEIVEAPDYIYPKRYYDVEPWQSSFSVSLYKGDLEAKE